MLIIEILFFLHKGYRKGEFAEFHFKGLIVAANLSDAVNEAELSLFYRQFGFKGTVSHIDGRYGVAIDEIRELADILPAYDKEQFRLIITDEIPLEDDQLHLGYITLSELKYMKQL